MMISATNFPQSRLSPQISPPLPILPHPPAMSTRTWIPLPTELIENILLYLSPRDLAHTREVSRMFRDAIEGSTLLFAQLYGYNLGPRGIVSQVNPAMRRLDLLKDRISRRFTSDWSRRTFQVPFFDKPRLVDGLLVGLGSRGVVCVDLPSEVRGTSHRLWMHDLSFQPFKFAYDPAQDVLILVDFDEETDEVTIHIRHLFESARRAPGAPIRPRDGVQWGEPLSVQVFGDLFGFLVIIVGAPPTVSLEMYDWKRGEFKAHFMCPLSTECFCFIADKVAIFPCFFIDEHVPIELAIVDFTRDVGEGIMTARLIFPGQGPFPWPRVHLFGVALPGRNEPFVTSPEIRITWSDSSAGSPSMFSPIEVLINPSSLLSLASSPSSPAPSPAIVPWNEWGRDARLIPAMKEQYGVMHMHPTRRAYLSPLRPDTRNDHDSPKPTSFRHQAPVFEVRIVEFGRIGSSAQNNMTPRMEAEDKIIPFSSYHSLPAPLQGDPVGLLTNTLQLSGPAHDLHEDYILSDEERIVILEHPFAYNPSDSVESQERDQTLTVFMG